MRWRYPNLLFLYLSQEPAGPKVCFYCWDFGLKVAVKREDWESLILETEKREWVLVRWYFKISQGRGGPGSAAAWPWVASIWRNQAPFSWNRFLCSFCCCGWGWGFIFLQFCPESLSISQISGRRNFRCCLIRSFRFQKHTLKRKKKNSTSKTKQNKKTANN